MGSLDERPPDHVAIIGAGLGGSALALALNRNSIPCRIYETRMPDAPEIASGVVLTPNGLHILNELGVFDRIKSICWQSEFRTTKNDRDETTRKTLIANEQLYGYKNHRLYRRVLLQEMRAMLDERNISVQYNARFGGVVSEDLESGVTFTINGKHENASLLVGADGIHSTIRQYLQPGALPDYTGVVGVLAHIQWSAVDWPYPDYERACTIQGQPGALFWIPEVADGSEIMVGLQTKRPLQTRTEWEAESADKDKLCEFYRKGYDEWTATGKKVIDAVCANKQSLFMWPFMRVPALERWSSRTGRIVIVGDAAHALPPSSAQGVNQALEDVYSLSLLLKLHPFSTSTPEGIAKRLVALGSWQKMRQERIDRIFDWATNVANVNRLPQDERDRLVREGKIADDDKGNDMSWLYKPVQDQDIIDQLEATA
ncbi:FAD/NAD(P)-binding domain-containing protein [Rhizodiscina lignyota]|uniref:FAD/NAD(P)-binding domain-containing protein n=1 Tax=Rhizodiscina lignyota TaxID=1504668 RepID=A0A9P4MGD9_9PEZI|nr:FAD/NAD(P)-binding domain-containing protein [Rhizodiscina lignyota]